jgi:leucyl aminopeptidase (aminopeptidase T)
MVPLGRVRHPVRFTIENRRIVSIEGGDADWLRGYLEGFGDDAVFTCPAEWGLGTNPAAIGSGKFLEEEVVYGIAHVALGDDTRFHNGRNFAPFHSDVMVREPSLELDGRLVLDRGEFRL